MSKTVFWHFNLYDLTSNRQHTVVNRHWWLFMTHNAYFTFSPGDSAVMNNNKMFAMLLWLSGTLAVMPIFTWSLCFVGDWHTRLAHCNAMFTGWWGSKGATDMRSNHTWRLIHHCNEETTYYTPYAPSIGAFPESVFFLQMSVHRIMYAVSGTLSI